MTHRTARLGVETMAVGTLHQQLDVVEVDTVVGTELQRAETDGLCRLIDVIAVRQQTECYLVEVRVLRVPGLDVLKTCLYRLAVNGFQRHQLSARCQVVALALDSHLQLLATLEVLTAQIGTQPAVGTGIDSHMLYLRLWLGHQVDGTVDAAKEPPVGTALSSVHRLVGRVLADLHFQQVLLAIKQLVGNVVTEPVKAALVYGTCLLTVDLHLGIGHGTLEDDAHLTAFPLAGHRKTVAVLAILLGKPVVVAVGPFLLAFAVVDIVATVGQSAIALLLPARGHVNLAPLAGAHPLGAAELPLHGILRSVTGEVNNLTLLRSYAAKE